MRTMTPAAPPPSSDSELLESTDPSNPEQANERAERDRRSRRSFVFFGALAAAATMLPRAARAQQIGRQIQRPNTDPRAPNPRFPMLSQTASADVFPEWSTSVGRLVRRVTQGMTASEMTRANSMGYDGYLEWQLNYTRIDDSIVEAYVAQQYPLLAQTNDQLFSANAGTIQSQLQMATAYRAAFSQRQLFHRMVELWTDHFNQDINKVGYLLASDQRDVIRQHALGKFPDLLKASAHSPSMLVYLDQYTSRSTPAPNQNYAREIMELHTLSVNGGYTQNDVADLSRVLTGWTITGKGTFAFNPGFHDWGSKTVLGVNIPAGSPSLGAAGQNEGEQMLNVLANHPSTAAFIATKMLRWLLDPNPSADKISTVAAVYRATGGDIKSMIRVILNESWVTAAPMKLKRPFHFMVSVLRSTNPAVTSAGSLPNQLNVLGHPIYNWATPDGFPDDISYWAGNIVPRWAYGSTASNYNSTTAILFDTTPYRAASAAAAIDLINQNFFGGEITASTKAALTTYLTAGTFNDTRVRETIGLAIASNPFQWY